MNYGIAQAIRLLHESRQRLRRRFTPLGRLLLWGILMAAILTPNPYIDLLELLTLCAALLLLGLTGTLLQHRHLQASRRLPRYCTVGEPLHYHVRVTNAGKRAVAGIIAVDELQGRTPTGRHGYRNWRQRRLLQRGGSIAPAEQRMQLAPGDTGDIKLELLPYRRGWLHFRRLHLLLADPLGLCNRPVTLTLTDSILCLPRRYRMHPLGGGAAAGCRRPLTRAGPSPDFLYLRDYRHGDPMQRIHWRRYAHHGQLLVREHEQPDRPRIGLLLDVCAPRQAHRNLEAAISVAASLLTSETHHDDNHVPSALIIGSRVRLQGSQPPDSARVWYMLEHVACATAEPEAELPRFAAASLRMATELGLETLVAVFPAWNPLRQNLCSTLREAGHGVLALVTGNAAPTASPAAPDGPIHLDIDHLEKELAQPLGDAGTPGGRATTWNHRLKQPGGAPV